MNADLVTPGLKIRTNHKLGSTQGYCVVPKHLEARKPSIEGVIRQYVPGHGGDVWFVGHDDGAIGVYCYDEFESIETTKEIHLTTAQILNLFRYLCKLRKIAELPINQQEIDELKDIFYLAEKIVVTKESF